MDGKASGEAFVSLSSEDKAKKAVERDKQKMGDR
jgi:hypothetical protein